MKKNKLTLAVVAGLAGVAGMASAAKHINPEGTGEVLVYPYYSVNNGLNTLYSVVNTTADTKAVKVRFLEGENTYEVLDFNVYLSAFDVWTGALLPTVSTQTGHNGEASGLHITFDTSCAPFLNKAGQEFLPFAIDTDFPSVAVGNNIMDRSTDGHFEIIEMATWSQGTATYAAADHGQTGVPASCATIESFWPGALWTGDLEEPTEGGLFGTANIINVDSGISMTYDAIAIDDFWANGLGQHTNPGDTSPSIASGDTNVTIFNEGVATTTNYLTGLEASSALFMRSSIYNEYALDQGAAGKAEWVITFPTKNRHVNNLLGTIPPFVNAWNGVGSCHEFGLTVWDREEFIEVIDDRRVSPTPPPGENAALCYEVNVLEFYLPGSIQGDTSSIMGSDNLLTVTTPDGAATENGWARMDFISDDGVPYVDAAGYLGLPVAGFAAQQFTNAGAGEGLLAQYAGLFMHKGQITSATP